MNVYINNSTSKLKSIFFSPKLKRNSKFKLKSVTDKNEYSDTLWSKPWKQYQDINTVTELNGQKYVKYVHERIKESEALKRAKEYEAFMHIRRSTRNFSSDPVDLKVVKSCITVAGTAPSGANLQPWGFVIVKSEEMKNKIRDIVENNEQLNFKKKMASKWVDDVMTILGSVHSREEVKKSYISEAPIIILVFEKRSIIDKDGNKMPTYYSSESLGIAVGFLTAALHNANLTMVHTTPLGSSDEICKLLNRSENERLVFLIPVGYPYKDSLIPYRPINNGRKPLPEILDVF